MKNVKIFPLGLDALTIEFGSEIDEKLNNRAINLARYFEKNPFEGLLETFPAYASVSIFYDFYTVKKNFPEFPDAFEAVKYLSEKALKNLPKKTEIKRRVIEIPASFDKKNAPDLEFVAEINNINPARVVEIYTAQIFRVFMLGFLPGFAYMGEVDDRISAPRKKSPRLRVPEGSIGIAGRQTGIYPLASPGGWQIIGKTDVKIFDLDKKNPTLFQVGDFVKFYESVA